MLVKKRTIKRPFDRREDMNFLPFIGIFFILTIPFMATRNNNLVPLDVSLPTLDYKIVVLDSDPIKVYINNEGSLYVDGNYARLGELKKTIDEASFKNFYRRIYVLADTNNSYGVVLRVVNVLRTNGYKNVALVSGVYNNFM
jgi:biopolymer transport protein ExbD